MLKDIGHQDVNQQDFYAQNQARQHSQGKLFEMVV